MTAIEARHCFPAAVASERPSHWWYWGRAVYVSRRDYGKIFLAFVSVGIPLGVTGMVTGWRVPLSAAFAVAAIGVALLTYSLVGLYRMYGHPSLRYYRQLLELGRVNDGVTIADLHIGTYRTAFALADLLPASTIHTIDCWPENGAPGEEAIADVRALEPAPSGNPRIRPSKAADLHLPLADESCDVVVFGFGTHEINGCGPRARLFKEARRILKPGGTALLFEHGYDFHNFLIFGPVIGHVTCLRDWLMTMDRYFGKVKYARSSAAVDLLAAKRHA